MLLFGFIKYIYVGLCCGTHSPAQPDMYFCKELAWQPDMYFCKELAWQPDMDFPKNLLGNLI